MSDTEDAYRPPDADLLELPAVKGRMYSPGQIAGGSFLGSLPATVWLLAANYRQLKQPKAVKATYLCGIVSTIVLFSLAAFLPMGIPALVIGATWSFFGFVAASYLQGDDYRAHRAAGGRKFSAVRVVVISLSVLLIFLAVVVAILAVITQLTPTPDASDLIGQARQPFQ